MTSRGLFGLIALALAVLVGLLGTSVQAGRRPPKATAAELAASASERPKVLTGSVLYVLDGDTLVLRPRIEPGTQTGPTSPTSQPSRPAPAAPPRTLRIRLAGIDAPELCQRGGGEARQALAALVQGRQVQVQMHTVDRYTRIVGRVMLGPDDVAAQLVAQGLAWSGDAGRHAGPYAAMESTARAQQRGVFADAQPTRPRDFRERVGACPHAPGSRIRQYQPQPQPQPGGS